MITTDGERIFGSITVSGNNVHRFNIGGPDQVSWWGFADTRNVLYHAPPGYGRRLHWLWLCFEDNPSRYQPNAGKVYYSNRPSDRGEWLFEMPKELPPDTPEEAQHKQRVLVMADTRAMPSGRPPRDHSEFQSREFGYKVQVPANWVRVAGPQGRRQGFLAPARYGVLQPYVDIFVWDVGNVQDIEKLGAMAARRWAGNRAQHWTLKTTDHPCGAEAYLLVYEALWSMDQMIVTKTWGLLRDGKEYRLNARCPVAAVKEWMPVLNRIMDSFRFAGPKSEATSPGEEQ
jgi:hypothetical protein